MIGSLNGRVRRLEAREDTGAPHACAIWYPVAGGWRAEVEIYATGGRLPLAEYERRWPQHPTLKAYLAEADEDGRCWLDLV